jgi:hypothetical protein
MAVQGLREWEESFEGGGLRMKCVVTSTLKRKLWEAQAPVRGGVPGVEAPKGQRL